MIDLLESRRLLSIASLTSKGTLNITGTSDVDDIVVQLNSSGKTLSVVNTGNFRVNQVKRIYVEAAGGDDSVDLTKAIAKPSVIIGGNGDDSIIAGAGKALLAGGAGDDTLSGDSLVDTFDGGSGNDLAIDNVLTRDSFTGKTATQIRNNLGDRGLSLEGFDLIAQVIEENQPKQNQTPPAFQNPTNGTPVSGSIFQNPGSIFGSMMGGVAGLFS